MTTASVTPIAPAPAPAAAPAEAADRLLADPYISAPVQVALEVLDRLLDTWPVPQSVAALTTATHGTRDQVYRACRNLAARGHAEDTPDGWMIGPAITAASERIRARTATLLSRYLGAHQ